MTKICRVCQTEHSLDLFPKGENRCKGCRADYDRQYYLKNPEKHAARQKRYNDKNRDKAAARFNQKRATDPLFKLRSTLATSIRQAIQGHGYTKKTKTYKLLGADLATVHQHLIDTAVKNYGAYDKSQKYHIDHIVPHSRAKTEEELLSLQHYSNLQLLLPNDNLTKSNKLDWTLKKSGHIS